MSVCRHQTQTAVADNVVGLVPGVFDVGVVEQTPGRQGKNAFTFSANPVTDTGGVDAGRCVIPVRSVFDGVRTGAEVHPAPLVTLRDAELLPPGTVGSHHHASRRCRRSGYLSPGHSRSILRAKRAQGQSA